MLHVLFVSLAVAPPTAPKAVTAAEKEAFIALVKTLPFSGEFYTDEAVQKAAPQVRVLLALTKEDIRKYDLYPFLALSRGLCDLKEPQRYAVKHFAKIAHPTIKLLWASVLFDEKAATPEIVKFLRAALASKEQAKVLSGMCGSDFEAFRKRVKDYRLKSDE